MRDATFRDSAVLHATPSLLRGPFAGKTLSRMMMHRLLSDIVQGVPDGLVVDLGATRTASYASMLDDLERRGVRTLTLSIDRDGRPDVTCDLDVSIPMAAESTDLLLALNLLEHLRRPERFMEECARVIRPDGRFCIYVPFLFPVHADPQDFRRFTAQCLMEMLEAAGFSILHLVPVGFGPFSAAYNQVQLALPRWIRPAWLLPALLLDRLQRRLIGSRTDRYPLSYFALAKRREVSLSPTAITVRTSM